MAELQSRDVTTANHVSQKQLVCVCLTFKQCLRYDDEIL